MSNIATLPLTAADLVCVEDLDAFASETASDLENLEQDLLHILLEDPGSNPDDVERGVGLPSLLSASTRSLNNITGIVESQLRKDDRIDQVHATLSELPAGYTFPSGLSLPNGGWLLELALVPTNALTGLSVTYAYSGATGLVAQ